MIVVLVVGSGAGWESEAVGLLAEQPGIVVLKRCVDVDDLLATAATGRASVAVVGVEAPGLDQPAVDHLRAHDVAPIAVVDAGPAEAGRARAQRLGIARVVGSDALGALPAAVRAAGDPDRPTGEGADGGVAAETAAPGLAGAAPGRGRVVAVWGPAGAPGRTTVAIALAAEVARRRMRAVLIDADPYGGSVAQHLGILDEVSGLLAAARLAGAAGDGVGRETGGVLDDEFDTVPRSVDRDLSVVTGLPRAERWVELRAGALPRLVDAAAARAGVVLDTGFALEDDPLADRGGRPTRNQLTLDALGCADEVVVVGSADPVGLARLVRGLVDLREVVPGTALRVAVNRMRPTLGWRESDIAEMVAGFARPAGLHFLPDDQPAVDRALVAGRTLLEGGESPLTKAVAAMVDAMA